MGRGNYSKDLVSAVREALRRMAESADVAPDDPAFCKLKKSLVLKVADQESGEPLVATTKDRS
jgi:hypothetical protein